MLARTAALAPAPIGLRPDLAAKLHRLRLFPGFMVASKLGIACRLHERRTRRAAAKLKSGHLAPLLAGQAPDALPQDPADLLYLYETVSRHNVRRAIEFGGGQSTKFIAQALHDRGQGHLWSLDADKRWLDHTEAMLPDHLRRFVTFVHSPVALTHDYGLPCWRYSIVPEGMWDFVLIDGPEGTEQSTFSCDLIELADRLAPGATGFIDHRWKTALLAKEKAGNSLRFRFVPSLESFAISSVAPRPNSEGAR